MLEDEWSTRLEKARRIKLKRNNPPKDVDKEEYEKIFLSGKE